MNKTDMFSGPRVWAYFIANHRREELDRLTGSPIGRLNKYEVLNVVRVRGEAPPALANGWSMVRVESLKERLPHLVSQSTVFRGVTQHLQYTTDSQRQELDIHSRSELPPSENTIAVLIPIGKSREWWELAQDQRQAYFQKGIKIDGHTAIGLRYVDRVFRKLYHSRYVDPTANYDFLTYFEFYDQHANDFRRLLTELRDATRNPEWNYVNLEFEIWMNKVA